MKFHTQNLLRNEDKNSGSIDFEYVYPRLGLRGAAMQVVDMFIETVNEYIATAKLDNNANLDAMYSTYADGQESFFKINGEEMEGEDSYVGDFFNSLSEVIIIIHGSNSPLRDLEPGQGDATYNHDFQDMYEAGEIDVTVRFPENPNDVPMFLETFRKELCGFLAHEMQHAVQKLIYGARLSEDVVNGLELHITDIFEIDARVEEVIARLPEQVHEENEDGFLTELNQYLDQYLARNASQIKNLEELKASMVETHLLHYHRKLGKNNVI
jgi:hypothetical protein